MPEKIQEFLDAAQQLRVKAFALMTDKEVDTPYQTAASRVGSACGEFLSLCLLIDFDKQNNIYVSTPKQ